jgi:hypothetical protein
MFARRFGTALVIALIAAAVGLGGTLEATASVKVGVLRCNIAPGIGLLVISSKKLACSFTPTSGASERYTGRVTRVGLDVGITGKGVLIWGGSSPHSGYARYALAGHYGGASAEASLIAGLGAKVLVGGSHKSLALQPVSVKGQVGVNIAAGVTGLTLTAAK